VRKGAAEGGGRHGSSWWRMLCTVRGGVSEGVGNWFEGNIRRLMGDDSSNFFG